MCFIYIISIMISFYLLSICIIYYYARLIVNFFPSLDSGPPFIPNTIVTSNNIDFHMSGAAR